MDFHFQLFLYEEKRRSQNVCDRSVMAALQVHFTPLGGIQGSDSAPCYLLQVDDFTFLLDCGLKMNAEVKKEGEAEQCETEKQLEEYVEMP